MRRTLPLVLGLILSTPLQAQTPAPATPFPVYRLSVVYAFGGAFGGPADPLADEMDQAGYGLTQPGGCFLYIICTGPTFYPIAEQPTGTITGLSARYALQPLFAIGAGFESGPIGGATGNGPDGFLTVAWDATSVWTAAYPTPSRGFRLGVGPSYHTLSQGDQHPKEHRFGVTAEMGVQFPRRSHLYVDIAGRYHFIPTSEVEVGTPGTPLVMTSQPHWSHFNTMFGVGLRI